MPHSSVFTVINLARNLLREEAGSDIPVISDAVMIQAVADADREIFDTFHIGGGNTPVERGLESGNTLASDTAINDVNGVTSASVTITVDSTTGFDTSGSAAIWDQDMFDIFYYTGLTPTSFTGVTGLSFSHADDCAVQALYKMPSNFGNFRRSEQYGDGASLNGYPLTYMEGPPDFDHFSSRDDGTNKYLWLYRGASGKASYLFDKVGTITALSDLVSFDDQWLFFYAWRVVEFCLFGRGDYQTIQIAKQKGDQAKLGNLKARNVGRRVRVREMAYIDNNYNLLLRENAL
jgi:hypothetical protein